LRRAIASNWTSRFGIADVAVDEGKTAKNVCGVRLLPFCRETVNLTYFRAPDIENDCRMEDELFGPTCGRQR